jgi:hypothetical protein
MKNALPPVWRAAGCEATGNAPKGNFLMSSCPLDVIGPGEATGALGGSAALAPPKRTTGHFCRFGAMAPPVRSRQQGPVLGGS